MTVENQFIMQKSVDWSLLIAGISIPQSTYTLFQVWNPDILQHGVSKQIKVLIDNELYDAKLVNQNFDQSIWKGHTDIIQIRYSEKSALAEKFKSCFSESYNYILSQRLLPENKRKQIKLPSEIHEYIRVFFTNDPDVLCIECCSNSENQGLVKVLEKIPEELYEASDDAFYMEDSNASIEVKEKLVKYRKLDKSIIRMLKEFYDYRDQISGEKIGSTYGESVVEAHHIDYFTTSQNNDSTNIIIISPNYHRIIHKNNPYYNKTKHQFEFANGQILKLKLFDHLRRIGQNAG